jgi:hypothetical protein
MFVPSEVLRVMFLVGIMGNTWVKQGSHQKIEMKTRENRNDLIEITVDS